MGVGLGERPEALVRVAHVFGPRGRDRVFIEGRACGLGERLRAEGLAGELDVFDQLSQVVRRVLVEHALRERGELADVVGTIRSRSDARPEVPEVGVAFPIEQYVGGAHPPVRDALSVREPERRGHLLHDERSTVLRAPISPGLEGREASSLQVPRDDVGATGLPPVVVDRDDVGVFERRGRLRLPFESPHERRVRGDLFVEDLDRDVAAHPGLDRSEHDPGGPLADLLQEPVAAQRLASQLEAGILPQDPLVEPRELR